MLDIWEKSGCSWFHFDVSVMHHSRWYMRACVFGFFQLSVAFSATPLRQWEKLWWTSVLRFWRATGRTVQVPHLLVRYCESICMHTPNFHIHQGHTLFTERLRTACLKLHCTTNESNECPRYNLYPFHMKPTKICPPHKLCFFLFFFCSPVDSARVYEVAPGLSELRAEEWCAATWSRRFIGWPSLPETADQLHGCCRDSRLFLPPPAASGESADKSPRRSNLISWMLWLRKSKTGGNTRASSYMIWPLWCCSLGQCNSLFYEARCKQINTVMLLKSTQWRCFVFLSITALISVW